MDLNKFKFTVLVNDKEVTEYSDGIDTFIEGRKGTEYKLKFENNKNERVLIVPSIDGISVFDGKQATADSLGIIVNANSSLVIPGWMVDSSTVASFLFHDKKESYSGDVVGNTNQAGVLGIIVYAEEKPEPVVEKTTYIPYPVTPVSPWVNPWPSTTPWVNPWIQNTPVVWTTSNNVNIKYVGSTNSLDEKLMGMSVSHDTTPITRSVNQAQSVERRITLNDNSDFNLGTSWGSAKEFKTTTKNFERGNIETAMLIFYDSRKNLERRGIIQTYQSRVYSKPQAFHGFGGCTPPKGWTK